MQVTHSVLFMLDSYFFVVIITVATFVAFRLYEGSFLPPSALFFIGYISSAFLYPAMILASDTKYYNFAYHNFDIATVYATQCFFALLIGYCLFFSFKRKNKRLSSAKIRNFQPKPKVLNVLVTMLVILMVIKVFNLPIFSLDGMNQAYLTSESVGVGYRIKFIAAQLLMPTVLMLSIFNALYPNLFSQRLNKITWFAVGLIILTTLLSFNRHAAAALIFVLGVFYHYRIKPIKFKYLALIFITLFTLQIFRLLRAFSRDELSVEIVLDMLINVDYSAIFVGVFTAIAGWDTFTNVIDIVPNYQSYKYGLTYLQSLYGVLTPRALGLSSYEALTPARWYMEVYSPGTLHHGFDFAILSEAYINFGPFMFIIFFIIGYIIAWLSKSIRSTNSPFAIFFAIIALQTLVFGLRMDSNAILKGMLLKPLPIILLILMVNKINFRAKR